MRTQMQGLAWARDSKTIVYGTENTGVTYLWRVDVDDGRAPERLEIAAAASACPATVRSRDRLVFARSRFDADIYRVGASGSPRPMIVSSFAEGFPSYSPDGSRIAFNRTAETAEIWGAGADGSSPQQLTRDMGPRQGAAKWAPDSRTIAFTSADSDGHDHIWTIDADGANLRQITAGPGKQRAPRWSNDGKWIYFSKNEGGGSNVWRIAVASRQDQQITRAGGDWAYESIDGKSLIYSKQPQQAGTPLLTVPLAGGPPRQLVGCTYGFSVGSTGIYYYPCRSTAAALPLSQFRTSDIRLIDWATRHDRLIRHLDGISYGDLFWGPSVSPDGTTFLYGKVVNEGQDLMMIENFR
jgi:Tol biopolymer transport system component